VTIADLVEELHLNAFERYRERPAHKPLHEWLDELVDLSVRAFAWQPDVERENVSFARSVSGMSPETQ
jgi:hypothetical protein